MASSKGGVRYNKRGILTSNSTQLAQQNRFKTARHKRVTVAAILFMLTYWSTLQQVVHSANWRFMSIFRLWRMLILYGDIMQRQLQTDSEGPKYLRQYLAYSTRKVTTSFVMAVCQSIRPHGASRFPLVIFSLNLIFEYFLTGFRKILKYQICWKSVRMELLGSLWSDFH
jgi:hypothetical protein